MNEIGNLNGTVGELARESKLETFRNENSICRGKMWFRILNSIRWNLRYIFIELKNIEIFVIVTSLKILNRLCACIEIFARELSGNGKILYKNSCMKSFNKLNIAWGCNKKWAIIEYLLSGGFVSKMTNYRKSDWK